MGCPASKGSKYEENTVAPEDGAMGQLREAATPSTGSTEPRVVQPFAGAAFVPEGTAVVAIFSAKRYVKDQMAPVLKKWPNSFFIGARCDVDTARLCRGANVVCCFLHDDINEKVIEIFQREGVKLIAMRCAAIADGTDNIDFKAAQAAGIRVVYVPGYSPHAMAEQAVALTLALNRHIHRCYNRVRDGNLELSGVVGMDLNGKTCGIIGTGKVGTIIARIFQGFGMKILGYDTNPSETFKNVGGEYKPLDSLYAEADVISLHIPLTKQTSYMINHMSLSKMKDGVILVNVSRGGLIDTKALITRLRTGKMSGVGLDVYEGEKNLFFQNLSELGRAERMRKWDEQFAILRSFPNVIVTPHSAFLTAEALKIVADTVVSNVEEFLARPAGKMTNEMLATDQMCDLDVGGTLDTELSVDLLHAEAEEMNDIGQKKEKSMAMLEEVRKEPCMTLRSTPKADEALALVDVEETTEPVVAIFSGKGYVREQMEILVQAYPKSFFVGVTCSPSTAALCKGANIACLFVNDDASKEVIEIFKKEGIQMITMRCAGFDRVDMQACREAGIKVARVPAYSPYAVAEHAVSLCMSINRHIHHCYNRVREGNFMLSGLVGMDMNGKVCGIVGTGKIGQIAAKIFKGFGMKILGYDPFHNQAFKEIGTYVSLEEMWPQVDVVSLHVPLMPQTKYTINADSLGKMKPGAMVINVSRGGLVDTAALIQACASGKISAAGLDVYENEDALFFKDFSLMPVKLRMETWDEDFARLRALPNVLVTPHSAFLTHEALENICKTTMFNCQQFSEHRPLTNLVK